MPFLIEGLAVGQDTIKTFADYAARDAYYDAPDPHLDELIQGITTIFVLDDGSGDPNMQRWFGDTDPAVYDSADWAIIPLSYVLPGTVDGQTLYWGNIALEWTPTDLLSVNPVAGTITINGINGIDINPGSDVDVDLITVGVTGTPKLSWDESEGAITLTNAREQQLSVGPTEYRMYCDTNDNDVNSFAGFKFYTNGLPGLATIKGTLGWDEVTDLVFIGYGAGGFGSGGAININPSNQVGMGTETPAAKLHVVDTTAQIRIGYSLTEYAKFISESDGRFVFENLVSTNPDIVFKAGNQITFSAEAGDNQVTLFSDDLRPITAQDDVINLGLTTARWKSLRIGTGDSSFAGQVGIGAAFPTSPLHIYVDNTTTLPLINAEQDGTGDAVIGWSLTASTSFISGIDNSDGNKWKLSRGSSLGVNNMITADPVTDTIGIITETPQETLDINGYATAKDTLETTDDTVLNLKSISVAEGEDVSIIIDIVGRRADGTERARYRITGLFYRNTSGNVTKEGSLQDVGTIDEDAWNAVDLVANTGTQEIDIELSPPDTTINWSSVIKYHKAVT